MFKGDTVKNCIVIYNPNSGKGYYLKKIDKMKEILLDYDYNSTFYKTE